LLSTDLYSAPPYGSNRRLRVLDNTAGKADARGRFIATAAFFVLFLSASLLLYSSGNSPLSPALSAIRFTGIGVGTLSIVLLGISERRGVNNRTPWALLAIWELFAFFCGASSVFNGSLGDDAIELFWIVFCVPLCFFVCGTTVISRFGFLPLLYGLSVAHATLICVSLAADPSLHFRYLGLFGDPNQLGYASIMAILAALALLPAKLAVFRDSWRTVCLITALIVVSFFLICVSSHRTSLLTLVMCLAISLARFRRLRVIGLGVLLSIVVSMCAVVMLSERATQVVAQMILKNSTAFEKGTLLDGRENIWRLAVQDIRLFGHGRRYFIDSTNGLGAHNSFLHILGTRGLLAAIALVGICIYSVALCWKLTRIRDLPIEMSQGALLMVVAYWAMGMTEGVFGSLGTGLHIAFLITLGYLASHRGRRSGVAMARPARRIYPPGERARNCSSLSPDGLASHP
jgi:O-antigen ligase